MLVAELAGSRVEASRELERGLLYMCPGCARDVILKRGKYKVAHFAHRVAEGCEFSFGETIGHLTSKRIFCDVARARGLRAEVEYVMGDQRADVAIWSPDNEVFVVELQHTNLPVDELKSRISGYRRKRVPQIWIPFIPKKYLSYYHEQDRRTYLNDDWIVERYSPRPFERYLSKIYKNTMWFYSEFHEMVLLGGFETLWLDKEGGEFGDESYASYEYRSRRWRKLVLEPAFKIDEMMYSVTPGRYLGLEMGP